MRSYSRAFSIACATSEATWIRKAASSDEKTRGASACSAITPIMRSPLSTSGTETSDWYFSSSSSGKYFTRGSESTSSLMKTGWRFSSTQPAMPSPAPIETRPQRCAYCSDAARSTIRRPPSSARKT